MNTTDDFTRTTDPTDLIITYDSLIKKCSRKYGLLPDFDDLCQLCRIKLARKSHLNKSNHPQEELAWVAVICKHVIYDHYNSLKEIPTTPDLPDTYVSPTPFEDLLPPSLLPLHRTLLIQRYVHRRTHRELSTMLNMAVGTIHAELKSAHASVKEYLSE